MTSKAIDFPSSTPRISLALAWLAVVALPLTSARAMEFLGEQVHFSPTTGQNIFPVGNLNIFKQYVVGANFNEKVGANTSIDLWLTTLRFGGSLEGGIDAAFGLEVGLCFGGNTTFDLGFQPSVTLPDVYAYDVPIPLTVSEGMLPMFQTIENGSPVVRYSNFETHFPPLGKAYADLVLDLGARLKASACVGGCFDAVDFDFSTCDIPALPGSGVKLFNKSIRCDPALTARQYCAIELASFNRADDNCFKRLNVGANSRVEFLAEPYKKYCLDDAAKKNFTVPVPAADELFVTGSLPFANNSPVRVTSSAVLPAGLDPSRIYFITGIRPSVSPSGTFFKLATSVGGGIIRTSSSGSGTHTAMEFKKPNDLLGGYGKLSMQIPTVSSHSMDSGFNTSRMLRSSGSEEVFGIGVDIARMAADFLIPPPVPSLSDSGSVGPIDWNYLLASVELGPSISLKTDFELTWDLEVKEISFTRNILINGIGSATQLYTPPAGTVNLTNSGPKALPMIQLMGPEPVGVNIKYVLKPMLRTVVSLPITGQLDYKFLAAGAGIDYGYGSFNLEFGPVVEDSHKFKAGEFKVYEGQPFPISGGVNPQTGLSTGNIAFTMQASGPPKFKWQSRGSENWTAKTPGGLANWDEFTNPTMPIQTSYPGETSNSSLAKIGKLSGLPDPRLYAVLEIDTLKVDPAGSLKITGVGGPGLSPAGGAKLTIGGGHVENTGSILIESYSTDSSLSLKGTDAILSGSSGTTLLKTYSGNLPSLRGPTGPTFRFSNYNAIRGVGEVIDQYGVNLNSMINNLGSFTADSEGRMDRNYLISSANHVSNQGVFESLADSDFSIYGDKLENGVGGRVDANGTDSNIYMSFLTVEHTGLVRAKSGGFLSIGPFGPLGTERASWNSGQSLSDNVGFFRSEGTGSIIQFSDTDMTGGSIYLGTGGSMDTYHTVFNGTDIQIGDFNGSFVDEGSGYLNLYGANQVFHGIRLTNNGTVKAWGNIEFAENRKFENSGKIEVPAGGRLLIRQTSIVSSGASDAALIEPGTANASSSRLVNKGLPNEALMGGTLMGGVWDITGSLEIEGATFAAIGANSATASTPAGYFDTLGNLVSPGETGASRAVSMGSPARVVLHGPNWSFAAIQSVLENRGTIELMDGAAFPGSTAPGGVTSGNFMNKGVVNIGPSGSFNVGGEYTQFGAGSHTILGNSANLNSATNSFRILGGTVTAPGGSNVFNIVGGELGAGTSLYIRALLVESENIDPYTGLPVSAQEPVVIDIGSNPINSISAGASLEIHGRTTFVSGDEGIYFPALGGNLQSNAGSFTLSGDGFPYSPDLSLINGLYNTGQVNLQGSGTKLFLDQGSYTQDGASSSFRVGPGATVAFSSDCTINGGEVVVGISARSPFGWFATGSGRAGSGFFKRAPGDLNNKLVIDFIGNLAETTVDVGDTWEIAPRTDAIVGLDTVTFRLNGGPIPPDWLPPGSELKVFQFQNPNDSTKRGLEIRVAPIGGFIDYYTWARTHGLPDRITTALADPANDGNGNGISNALEFFYGLNGLDKTTPEQSVAVQSGGDGRKYFEISYVRPAGIDASYTPYVSEDLRKWTVAPMNIMNIDTSLPGGLARVTLRSSSPISVDRMFYRIQPNFNPDNFDAGILADTFESKFINWSSGMDHFDGVLADEGYNVSYNVVPGRVLYLNVSGTYSGMNSVQGGTAPNGVDRNYIYQSYSPIGAAVVHAGLLNGNGENGIIKVTFLPHQSSDFIGSTQITQDGNEVTSRDAVPGTPANDPYVYKVEIERISNKTTPTVSWPYPAAINYGTPLGTEQLNAISTIPGTFTYTPPLGTVLDPGLIRILTVVFTPADSIRYNVVTGTAQIRVYPPPSFAGE